MLQDSRLWIHSPLTSDLSFLYIEVESDLQDHYRTSSYSKGIHSTSYHNNTTLTNTQLLFYITTLLIVPLRYIMSHHSTVASAIGLVIAFLFHLDIWIILFPNLRGQNLLKVSHLVFPVFWASHNSIVVGPIPRSSHKTIVHSWFFLGNKGLE